MIVSVFSAQLGSILNTCAALVYEAFWKRGFSLGDDFRIVSVFSVELDSTANTCAASVYEAFWKRGFSLRDDFRIVSVFSAELGSTANTCAASVYEAFWKRGFSLGDDFRIVSVFSVELGSTANTCAASVYEAFWKRGFFWEMTSRLSPYSALSLGRQWIHVGFSLCCFWKNFTRFLRVRFLSCPLLCTTCAGWSRQCRIAWRCRRCSSCAVVDVVVFMQRQVPGSPGTRFRSVHRQVRDGLKWAFCLIFEAFFALRPAGREGQGGGDAGSLLPGVLPHQLGAFVMGHG